MGYGFYHMICIAILNQKMFPMIWWLHWAESSAIRCQKGYRYGGEEVSQNKGRKINTGEGRLSETMWVLWFWDRPVVFWHLSGQISSDGLNHPSHGGFVRNTSERTTVQAMNEKKVMWWNCPSQKVEVASNEFSIGKSKPSSYFSSPKPPWLGFDSVGDHELSPRPRGTAFIAVLCVGDLGTHSKVMGLRSLYKSSLSPAEWSVWQFLDYESDEKLDGPIFGTCNKDRCIHRCTWVQGTVVEKGMVQSLHVGLYELSTVLIYFFFWYLCHLFWPLSYLNKEAWCISSMSFGAYVSLYENVRTRSGINVMTVWRFTGAEAGWLPVLCYRAGQPGRPVKS